MTGIPILTYHSMNIAGNGYGENDHVAFADDLRRIHGGGWRILPLHEIVARRQASAAAFEAGRVVALTCDDGGDFDFHDLPHPVAGTQRSLINILRDFEAEFPGAQPGLHVTSFVIASPEARVILDRTCMIGRGWWNDDWWIAAIESGLMGIANHSWDHNHEQVPQGGFPGVERGTFRTIGTEALADYQVRRAADYIREIAPNPSTRLFAYPYGESSDFLVQEYFPRHAAALGIDAAFSNEPQPIDDASDRWCLPRYTCGRDWKSPEELQRILDDAAR